MSDKVRKIISLSLGLLLVLTMLQVQIAEASTFSISAPSSVNASTNFTVTFGSGTTGTYSYSVSGGTIVSSSTWVEGGGSLTVKSGTSGSVKVTVTTIKVSDSSYNDFPAGTSRSVTVSINTSSSSSNNNTGSNSSSNSSTSTQVTDTRSSDNSLKSLSIDGLELSPGFSSGTTSYTAEIWDQANITVNASAKDSKATVSGAGKKDLALGKNAIEVKVTAENGSVKTYTINVTLNQRPTVYMEYKGKSLGAVKNTSEVKVFSGFDRCIAEYNMQEIQGWYSSELAMTILYLIEKMM